MKRISLSFVPLCMAILCLFITWGCNSSDISGPTIEKEQEIKNYFIGKWNTEFFELGTNWYYRFEFTDKKFSYWVKYGENKWSSEPSGSHEYSISEVKTNANGNKWRDVIFEGEDLGLSRGGYLNYQGDGCISFSNTCLKKGWK